MGKPWLKIVFKKLLQDLIQCPKNFLAQYFATSCPIGAIYNLRRPESTLGLDVIVKSAFNDHERVVARSDRALCCVSVCDFMLKTENPSARFHGSIFE